MHSRCVSTSKCDNFEPGSFAIISISVNIKNNQFPPQKNVLPLICFLSCIMSDSYPGPLTYTLQVPVSFVFCLPSVLPQSPFSSNQQNKCFMGPTLLCHIGWLDVLPVLKERTSQTDDVNPVLLLRRYIRGGPRRRVGRAEKASWGTGTSVLSLKGR